MLPSSFREISRPITCGVYALVLRDEVVYVGQSTDIDRRVSAHYARRSHMRFDRVFMVEVARCDLDAVEGALIRALNPVYNGMAPRDTGRDLEILAKLGIDPDLSNAFNKRNFEERSARMSRRFDEERTS